jgi:hypothetical protein
MLFTGEARLEWIEGRNVSIDYRWRWFDAALL